MISSSSSRSSTIIDDNVVTIISSSSRSIIIISIVVLLLLWVARTAPPRAAARRGSEVRGGLECEPGRVFVIWVLCSFSCLDFGVLRISLFIYVSCLLCLLMSIMLIVCCGELGRVLVYEPVSVARMRMHIGTRLHAHRRMHACALAMHAYSSLWHRCMHLHAQLSGSGAYMSGWRNTVGNLIETCWPKTTTTGLNLLIYAWNTGGYIFIEFEISNSTISTAFRQPLITGCIACMRL